jgi:DNA-binding beta-propeller fold protein YncE
MRKLMAKGGVIVANGVLGCEVDERSVFGVGEAGFVIDRLGKAVYITQVKSPLIPDSNFDSNLPVEHREMVAFI